jgi:hypothetical protein
MLIVKQPFVRGMVLKGLGAETVKSQRMKKRGPRTDTGIYGQVGSGTIEDPTVAWLIDVETRKIVDPETMQDHVDIARRVAIDYGFPCILIRKESHPKRNTHTVTGARLTQRTGGGREVPVLLEADPHMTVFMGPNTKSTMVEGHIYTRKVMNFKTGRMELQWLDDPASQRTPKNMAPGTKMVAEEFWITNGSWAAAPQKGPAAEKAKAAERPRGLNVVQEEEEEEEPEQYSGRGGRRW